MTSRRVVLRTALCDLLGIDYPILQSGMGLIAGPDLAAEVSKAGGLGIVAGFMLTADQLRAAIRDVRARRAGRSASTCGFQLTCGRRPLKSPVRASSRSKRP